MKRRRVPSEAELSLWRHVMRDIAPPENTPDHKAEPPEPPRPEPASGPAPDRRQKPPRRIVRPVPPAPREPVSYDLGGPLIKPLGPATPGLDRATAQRLSKGARKPDGKIDLHGRTLDAAHAALTRFILDSAARDRRCVLVVTGKGGDYRKRAETHMRPNRYDDNHFVMPERRGALREAVPRWLQQTPLAQHVVGVYQAHPRHGGEGALYVYLKRQRFQDRP